MNAPMFRSQYIHKATLGIGIALITMSSSTVPATQTNQQTPVVAAANVPFYPPIARIARIEGEVRLTVSTNGETITEVQVERGQPMLARAAHENLKTWRFEKHAPRQFSVVFRYIMLSESVCEMDSGTVVLRLPEEIEISAKGVRTCDPAEVVPKPET